MNNTNRKNTIGLMGSCLMNNILYMFLNTFMIAYFVTLTNYDYKLISMYYIISFVFIILTFLVLGRIIKNKTQVSIFRIGIVLHCIYVLTLALLKEDMIHYYLYLGAFYGIVQGFFWSAGHSLINEHIGNNSGKFISVKSMFDRFFKILFPIIFGVSIELTSFSYIAKIVLVLSAIQIIFSLFIQDHSVICEKKYNLKEFIHDLKIRKSKSLKVYYKMNCCDGIVSYLLDTLITLMIVMTFKTTISLGFLTTLFAIGSIISIFIYQNKVKNKKRLLKFGAIAMVISVCLLLFDINKITVIIYNFCSSIFLILLRNKAQASRYTIVSQEKTIEKNYLVEHQVVSEIVLNISRILGYSILFIVSFFHNMIVFKLLLVLVTIIISIYAKLIINLDKKQTQEFSTEDLNQNQKKIVL